VGTARALAKCYGAYRRIPRGLTVRTPKEFT